jgi:hypothetical protein
MSWGNHPDTMTMAGAHGTAEKSGHTRGTIAYLREYRAAYAKLAGNDPRVKQYLEGLDRQIAENKEPAYG